MMRLVYSSVYAAVAVVVLWLITPFLPSSFLIQPVDLEIEDNHLEYTRTVTVETNADFTTEVTQGREVFEQCGASGSTFFEERGLEPVVWHFPCELPDGEYEVSVCVSASWFGVPMRPACLTEEWVVGEPVDLEIQLDTIQKQVEGLAKEIMRSR